MDYIVTEKNYKKGQSLGERAEALFNTATINKPPFFVITSSFFDNCFKNTEFTIDGINAIYPHIKANEHYDLVPAVFLKNSTEIKNAIPDVENITEQELASTLLQLHNELYSLAVLKRKKELGSTDPISLTVLVKQRLSYDELIIVQPLAEPSTKYEIIVNKVREKLHPFFNITVGIFKGKIYLVNAEVSAELKRFENAKYTKTLVATLVADFVGGVISPLTQSFYIMLIEKILNDQIVEIAFSRIFVNVEQLEKLSKRIKKPNKPLICEPIPESLDISSYTEAFDQLVKLAIPAFKNALFFKTVESENRAAGASKLLTEIVGAISLNADICSDFKTLNAERLKRKYQYMNAVQDFLFNYGVLTENTFKLETETLLEDCLPLFNAIELSLKTGECDIKLSTLNSHAFLAARFVSAFRKIFLNIGAEFSECGLINYPKDIFYLYYNDIFNYYKNKNVDHEFKKKVSARTLEFNENKIMKIKNKIVFYNNEPILYTEK